MPSPAGDHETETRQIQAPLGRHYDVNGRRLLLHRGGSGGPSVVFLPGAGLLGLDYLNIHDRITEFTTSVVYDRAGTGWSDPVDLPRDATTVTDELRELLRVADVPAPYVLVGHSLGAFYARRYAQRHPDEVAGLLLLDPGHEDMFAYLPEEAVALNEQMKPDLDQLPDLTAEQYDASAAALTRLYDWWPDAVRGPLVERHLASWRDGVAETTNLESEVYDELRAGGEIPEVALIVLSATGQNPYWAKFLTDQQMADAHAGILALHTAIAASMPGGEHRTVDGASHQYLHVEYPDTVVRAVRDLLDKVDSPGT